MKEPVTIIDNPLAPEVFVTAAVGLIASHGNVHITFAAVRADHTPNGVLPADRVNLRIVMPMSRAYAFAAQLFEYAKEQGAAPATALQ